MNVKVVCGWCQRTMVEGDETKPVSHGICDECKKSWKR